MIYDFDRLIDRRGTGSLKFDFAIERGLPEDALALWVADMDFPAPQPVLDKIRQMTEHGIFGYTEVKEDYFRAVSGWFDRHFDWQPEPEWLVKTPGVVFALAMAIKALTEKGDAVLIQPPVYYPFYEVIRDNGRKIVESPLRYQDGRYDIDFEDVERKIAENGVKLFLLCSPHNPVGRVWSKKELRELGRILKAHHVYVVSDEIHCDFAFPAHPHTIFTQAVPELKEKTIVCTAPSKTFNLAGLQVSNIFIPGKDVRGRFRHEIGAAGYSQLNAVGLAACQAAYTQGEEWYGQCTAYLQENLRFFRDFLQKYIPRLRLVEPEGTYFAWVDFSSLGLDQASLGDLIVNRAKLWLDAGHIFGKASGQFQRFVLACPRQTLRQALEQLKTAVDALNL